MVNKMEKCLHPVLAKRDQNWFCSRIQAEMKQQGLGYLILQTPYNVMYATGYSPLVGSSAAIIPAEGDAHLIISTLESADAYASTNNVDVREFMSWVFIDNGTEESRRDKGDVMDPDAVVHMTIDLIKNTPMDGKVGIEMGSVSHAFYGKLAASLPEGMIVDGSSVTRNCRVVKCQWEIDMLRLAATEADKAWRAMAAEIKPGMPAWKLDAMFAYEASKLNLEHGTCGRSHSFIPAVGPYYGLCGVPRGYILQAGDVIKFDVGYSYFGYWSDIARTFAVGGTAPDEVLEIYDTLYKANRMGVEMLKPGTPMKDIYNAIRRDALLENVTLDENGKIDFADKSVTENTRVSYPIDHIEKIVRPVSAAPAAKNVIFLSADAFGVLPPVSILTPEQTQYYFLSGFTAKLAGTERGITEPTPTFSACFGQAFLELHPTKYAEELVKKMQKSGAKAYLVNTGWNGTGKRISIKDTRGIIDAILSGAINEAPTKKIPYFDFEVPTQLPGVDPAILDPRDTYADASQWEEKAKDLAGRFIKNFAKYEGNEHGKALVSAGPQL